jgi:hypothetical protein
LRCSDNTLNTRVLLACRSIHNARAKVADALTRLEKCRKAVDSAAVPYTAAEKALIMGSQLPWVQTATVSAAAQRSLFRRWHTASADLQRTGEEFKIKPKEAVRALSNYAKETRVIGAACTALRAELVAPVADAEKTPAWAAAQSMRAAKLYVLDLRVAHLASLQARAGQLWANGRSAGARSKAVPGIPGVIPYLQQRAAASASDAAAAAAATGEPVSADAQLDGSDEEEEGEEGAAEPPAADADAANADAPNAEDGEWL